MVRCGERPRRTRRRAAPPTTHVQAGPRRGTGQDARCSPRCAESCRCAVHPRPGPREHRRSHGRAAGPRRPPAAELRHARARRSPDHPAPTSVPPVACRAFHARRARRHAAPARGGRSVHRPRSEGHVARHPGSAVARHRGPAGASRRAGNQAGHRTRCLPTGHLHRPTTARDAGVRPSRFPTPAHRSVPRTTRRRPVQHLTERRPTAARPTAGRPIERSPSASHRCAARPNGAHPHAARSIAGLPPTKPHSEKPPKGQTDEPTEVRPNASPRTETVVRPAENLPPGTHPSVARPGAAPRSAPTPAALPQAPDRRHSCPKHARRPGTRACAHRRQSPRCATSHERLRPRPELTRNHHVTPVAARRPNRVPRSPRRCAEPNPGSHRAERRRGLGRRPRRKHAATRLNAPLPSPTEPHQPCVRNLEAARRTRPNHRGHVHRRVPRRRPAPQAVRTPSLPTGSHPTVNPTNSTTTCPTGRPPAALRRHRAGLAAVRRTVALGIHDRRCSSVTLLAVCGVHHPRQVAPRPTSTRLPTRPDNKDLFLCRLDASRLSPPSAGARHRIVRRSTVRHRANLGDVAAVLDRVGHLPSPTTTRMPRGIQGRAARPALPIAEPIGPVTTSLGAGITSRVGFTSRSAVVPQSIANSAIVDPLVSNATDPKKLGTWLVGGGRTPGTTQTGILAPRPECRKAPQGFLGGPSCNGCPAASYSPTSWRMQYHRR